MVNASEGVMRHPLRRAKWIYETVEPIGGSPVTVLSLQRHRDKLRDIIQHHRGTPQAGLVYVLNPVIQGWANYYQYCVAKHDFQILDNTLYHQLTCWPKYRCITLLRSLVAASQFTLSFSQKGEVNRVRQQGKHVSFTIQQKAIGVAVHG